MKYLKLFENFYDWDDEDEEEDSELAIEDYPYSVATFNTMESNSDIVAHYPTFIQALEKALELCPNFFGVEIILNKEKSINSIIWIKTLEMEEPEIYNN